MLATINYTSVLEVLDCASCGTPFGVQQHLLDKFRGNGQTFYCPLGHHNIYRETTEQKLKKELTQAANALAFEKSRHDQTKADRDFQRRERNKTERSLTATRGVVTRIKNRIAAGVCPCCNRHFTNLERHMSGQHPEFKTTEDVPEAVEKRCV